MDAAARMSFYEVSWPAPVNLLLDITSDVDRKRQALRCFASQLELHDYLRHMEALNVYRTYTLPRQVRAAEGFLTLSAGELASAPMRCFGRSRLTDEVLS
jgi:LmbE family N-acetylglucosaminyl deacetylase